MREPRRRCLLQPTQDPTPPAMAGLHSTTAPLIDATHKLPHVGKCNRREPGKGKEMLGIISYHEMELWCNWHTYAGLGSCLDGTTLEGSQYNSSPPSTSPLDLPPSFGDCSTKTFSTETKLRGHIGAFNSFYTV